MPPIRMKAATSGRGEEYAMRHEKQIGRQRQRRGFRVRNG